MRCSPPVVMRSPAAASPVSGGHRWSAECLQCPLVKRWVEPIRTAALPHRALLLCCWQLATHMLYQLRRNGPKLLPTPMSQKPSLHAIMLGGITVKHVHLSQVCVSHANLGSTNWVTTTWHTCIYMSMVPNIQGAQLSWVDLPKDFAEYIPFSIEVAFAAFQKQTFWTSKVWNKSCTEVMVQGIVHEDCAQRHLQRSFCVNMEELVCRLG